MCLIKKVCSLFLEIMKNEETHVEIVATIFHVVIVTTKSKMQKTANAKTI